MIVTVILPAAKLDKVKQGLESQKSAGISFEYFTNVAEVFTLINERGFYMDKLVFIASVLADFNDADMQVLIDNLCNVCELYLLDDTKNKEILMIDSGLLFEMEYHQFFHSYPSFIYQSQKVHPSQLFGLIAGNFITAENPNVIEESKKPSFFSKVFGKKKQAATETADAVSDEPPVPEASDQQQVQYSDAPLFADVDVEESKSTQEQNDLDFDINFSSQPEKEEQAEPIEDLSNTPLFEDEPESEPKPEPEPKVDIQKEQRRFSSPFKNKQPPLQKNTATAQVAKVATRSKKVIAKTYIEFFQKRSKIVLFTGDRRSGSSTVAACLAEQAARDGLYVLLLDLDYERRGQSINFPMQFDDNDTQRILSLYHAIKNASNIDEYALQINDNLDFLGTSIQADSTDFMYEHVNNSALQTLLSIALSKYDLILVDCPFLDLKKYTCLVAMSNYIIHSTATDYRAIVNLVNMLTPEDFATNTDFSLYMTKLMFLLNQFKTHFWNNVEINERNLNQYMIDMTGDDMYRSLTAVGRIPEFNDYDEFMSEGNLLIDNKNYTDIFIELLNNIAAKG